MKIVDRRQLLAAIYSESMWPSSISILDEEYAMPVRDTLLSELREELPLVAASLGWDYKWEEFQDCDDFALFARSIVGLKHQLASKKHKIPEGIAFGVLCYLIGGNAGNGHAINFFISPEGDGLKVTYYEPQTLKVVRLTEKEKQSAYSIII